MRELELGMSNFDNRIDEGLEEALRESPGEVYGSHVGWGFCGKVWFKDGKFYEEVWKYHSKMGTVSSKVLSRLMRRVNNKYGRG